MSVASRALTLQVFDEGIRNAKAVLKLERISVAEADRAEKAGAVERFRAACALLQGVSHPATSVPHTWAVVHTADGEQWGYSARNWVTGSSLAELAPHYSPREALRVALQLSEGLAKAHRHGVVHGDIKPENVVVRRASGAAIDELSQCVLIDWQGLAPVEPTTNALSDFSVQFAAPELMSGAPPSPSTDIYALGVMLHRLISGRMPFEGPTLSAIIRRQRSGQHIPIDEDDGRVPSEMSRVIDRMIHPYPAHRPESVQHAIALLSAIAEELHMPIGLAARLPQRSFVGREQGLATCLHAIWSQEAPTTARAISVTASPGGGVSTFLRELVDRLEASGARPITLAPNEVAGDQMVEQLRRQVQSYLRGRAPADRVSDPTDPRTAPKVLATDILNDLAVLAQANTVVVVVDDFELCDLDEYYLLERISRQAAGALSSGHGDVPRSVLVVAGHLVEKLEVVGQVTGYAGATVVLAPLSVADFRRSLVEAGTFENVTQGDADRLWRACDGAPTGVTAALTMLGDQLAHGIDWPTAVERVAVSIEGDDEAIKAGMTREHAAIGPSDLVVGAIREWGGAVTPSELASLEVEFCAPPLGSDSGLLGLRSGTGGRIVATRGERLGERGPSHQSSALERRVRRAADKLADSRSNVKSTEDLCEFARYCARVPAYCRSKQWALCRALLLLLRRGRCGVVQLCARSIASRSSDSEFAAKCRGLALRAEVESGRSVTQAELEPSPARLLPRSEAVWAKFLYAVRTDRPKAWRLASDILADRNDLHLGPVEMSELAALAIDSGDPATAQSIRRELRGRLRRVFHCQRGRPERGPACAADAPSGPSGILSLWLGVARVESRCCMAGREFARAAKWASIERRVAVRARWATRDAAAINNEAIARLAGGDNAAAIGLFDLSAKQRSALDDERGLVVALNNGALARIQNGDYGSAISTLNRCRLIASRNNAVRHIDLATLNLGLSYYRVGQYQRARRTLFGLIRNRSDESSTAIQERGLLLYSQIALDMWHVGVACRALGAVDRLRAVGGAAADSIPVDSYRAEILSRVQDWPLLAECLESPAWKDEAAGYARLGVRAREHRGVAFSRKAREIPRRSSLKSVRVDLWLRRWDCRAEPGISVASVARAIRLTAKYGLTRSGLEWLLIFLRAHKNVEPDQLEFCLARLSELSCESAHADIQCLLRATLSRALVQAKRPHEAMPLAWQALQQFSDLERRIVRCGYGANVINSTEQELRRVLGLRRVSGCGRDLNRAARIRSECAIAWSVTSKADVEEQGCGMQFIEDLVDVLRSHDGSRHARTVMILEATARSLGAERAALLLRSPNGVTMDCCVGARGSVHQPTLSDEISWATVHSAMATGESQMYEDAIAEEQLASHRSIADLRLRSLACAPVRVGGEVVGALYLDHQRVAGLFRASGLIRIELAAGLLAAEIRIERIEFDHGASVKQAEAASSMALRAERSRFSSEVAAGLSHDLKNVLAAISARGQLIRRATIDARLDSQVRAIESAAEAGAQLIERIQECGRDHALQPRELVNVRHAIAEALELADHRLRVGTSAEVRAQIVGRCHGYVEAVAGELREVFLNLFLNACDAMSAGGVLSISIEACGAGDAVEIRVGDTGEGISEAVLDRIFDPFFTTKGRAGTGLGLVVVKDVILRAGGSISVESRRGEGTEFRVVLPIALPVTGRPSRGTLGPV